MSEQEQRLLRCFASVFPGLTQSEIQESCEESTGAWDSLSGVTLVAVIEEEFSIQIEPDAYSALNCFNAFNTYLQKINLTGE
jgi:acyl carrier protein